MTDLAPHGGCWNEECTICNTPYSPYPKSWKRSVEVTEADAEILRGEPAPLVRLVPGIVIEDDDEPIGTAYMGDIE